MSGNLIQANALSIPLKDKSVQLCCFSPPYWNLRKYSIGPTVFPDGFKGQLGLEPSIDLFLDHLMLVMREAWRVLRDDGVCFVNIGDSYAGSGGEHKPHHKSNSKLQHKAGFSKKCLDDEFVRPVSRMSKIKPKSLCLIPQKFAIRCQEAGWVVRSEIIWHKPNPMPESCRDRPTKAHEQVWMLAKQWKYFFDQEAVREQSQDKHPHYQTTTEEYAPKSSKRVKKDGKPTDVFKQYRRNCAGRNVRTVWTLSSESCPEAHFATWPSKLVETMIRAGSSPRACEICGSPWERIVEKRFVPQEDISLERGIRCCPGQKPMDEQNQWSGFPRGRNQTKTSGWKPTCECINKGIGKCVVADIFCGVGTTVLVAEKLGRTGVGLDLSVEYLWDMAKEKIEAPMQKELF